MLRPLVVTDHAGMLTRQSCSQRHAFVGTQLAERSASSERQQCRQRHQVVVYADKQKQKEEPGIGLKAAWAAAEQYGNLVGGKKGGKVPAEQKVCAEKADMHTCVTLQHDAICDRSAWCLLQKNISREDALASIRADYECNYFVSGKGELAAYDPECEFRDDFAAFNGVGEWNVYTMALIRARNPEMVKQAS
jgi:hypothetical protein